MNHKNLRILNEIEFRRIETALKQISPKIIDFLQAQRSLLFTLTSKHDTKDLVYLVKDELKNLIENLQNDVDVTSIGIYLGFFSKRSFFLSLEGAECILKNNLIPDQYKLNVNIEGEKSILYGNPITKKMILKSVPKVKKGNIILILTQLSELISLGFLEVDLEKINALNDNEIIARNLIDKGYYLRRKQ